MESILLAFNAIVASLRSLVLDHNNAFATLVAKLNLLASRKAEQSQVDVIQTDVNTVKSTVVTLGNQVNSVITDVSNAKNDIVTVKGDISALQATAGTVVTDIAEIKSDVTLVKTDVQSVAVDMTAVKQYILDAGIREFEYFQDAAEPADIVATLSAKATELGAGLVNQQYTLNCGVGTSLIYNDVDGNAIMVELPDGGKVVATYKDGVIVNVIAIPAQSGGISPITVDTTVDAPTGTTSLSGLSSYFN